jgi:NADH-quinone oxidoreductase subunit N
MPIASFPSLGAAAPEIFLALAAMGLLMAGVFVRVERDAATLTSFGGICVLIAAAALAIVLGGPPRITFGGAFIFDNYAAFLKVLILVSGAAVILIARDYLHRHDIDRFEFPVLIVLASLGMSMMVSANDLIALYLGLELQSLALYVIASFQRDGMRSAEAGLKYFVLGALASGLLLYGASLVYGFAGTTSFVQLAQLFKASAPVPTGLIVGIVFILAGLAFKVSAVPFHMWTPDVYEGAPTPVTALFAVAPKLAAMGLLIRVMTGPFGELGAQWQQVVVFISVASMILGAVAAINQRNIKRLMAYSSIGNMGYALIGVAVAAEAGDPAVRADGVENTLIFLAIYVFMNLGTFAVILTMRRGGRMVEEIDSLAGLSKTNPLMALVLSAFMFSMAGIPPLAGFFGKLYIFQAAVKAELFGLAIIGVLASVVAAFYYIRIVKVMYFDAAEEAFDGPISLEMKSVLFVTFAFIALFIVFPLPLLAGASIATASLFGG